MYKLKNKIYWIVFLNAIDFVMTSGEKILRSDVFEEVNILLTKYVGTYVFAIIKLIFVPVFAIAIYHLIKKYELSSRKIIAYSINGCLISYSLAMIAHLKFIIQAVL
jgi:hypothetical protein